MLLKDKNDTLKRTDILCRYIMLNVDSVSTSKKSIFNQGCQNNLLVSIYYRELFHWELCAKKHIRIDSQKGNFALETVCTLKKELLLLS